MKKNILIIDPFSTGKMYAKAFSELGYLCYSVLSSSNIPDFFKKSYESRYFQNKKMLSVDEVKQLFTPEQIFAVVIGAETGVFVGEQLADYFNVAGNSPQTTHFRRDKFAMQQQLKKANLNHIESHIITENNQEILSSLPDISYVLKPLNAAGTENVSFCKNKQTLYTEIAKIEWGKQNITGEENNQFLVQEFISGQEFVVDMVVENNKIHTASLCRYKKAAYNQSQFVYEYMEMLDPQASEFKTLIDYAHQCTQALGFQFGPVHMEIMFSPKGAVMIEAGGRLHGGIAPLIFQHCYHPDLLQQAVKFYLNFANLVPTKQTKYAKVLFMINQKENAMFDSIRFQQEIQRLSSFVHCVTALNNPLPLTVDLLTCPCLVALASENETQLMIDERTIRQLFDQHL